MPSLSRTRETVVLALLIAIALVLSYFERLIPMNIGVPGVKLGLANVVTLLSLYSFRPSKIYLLIVTRVLLAALIVGSVMGFWYSLAGGLFSGTAMMLSAKFLNGKVSLIGISAIGALCHNVGQLIIVSIVTGSIYVAVSYAPLLLVTGTITGIFIGLVGGATKPHLVRVLAGNR